MLGFKFILSLSFIIGIEGEYTYYKQAGGSLKSHSLTATWHDARMRCHLEGGVLASPLNNGLLEVMKEIISSVVQYPNSEIFVGFHATFSKGDFFSIEGVPIADAPIDWKPYNYNNEDCVTLNRYGQARDKTCDVPLSYMCFKGGVPKLVEVGPCGPIDNGYILDNRTSSCYKLHTTARTWSRAFMACSVESAHLTVINSDLEAQVLSDLFPELSQNNMVMSSEKDYAYIGVQDWGERGDWQTVHGQTLTAAGYASFVSGAPFGTGDCLVVRRDGLLADVAGDTVHVFFCEKRPAAH